MLPDVAMWIAVVILAAASAALLVSTDWRWSLGLLAIQYLAAFTLVMQYWPLGMAAVKLITGWMATAALGMTRLNLHGEDKTASTHTTEERPFWLIGAAIVILIALASAPRVEALIPGIGMPVTMGSSIMIGTGLLQLGRSSQVLRVVVGLLTLLCGFETLYAAVESSILVAALLAVVNLGLAITGSYLLLSMAASKEEEPT